MKHAQSPVVLRNWGRPPVSRVVGKCACWIVFLLIAGGAAAQQETLGSILDKGAKKMSRAEVTAAMLRGMLGRTVGSDDLVLTNVSYESDGSMLGQHQAVGQVRGDWSVDDDGRECHQWWGGGELICSFWFKLGDSVYLAKSTERGEPVSKLTAQ